MSYTISVLTDEVSPDLASGLRFAAEEGLTTVDIRSVGGTNFLSLERAEQERIARQLRDAGLAVGCLATPLLKWPAPGRSAASSGDQFGFEPRGRSTADLYDDAVRAADILATRHLRIFSLLTYQGFAPADLEADYGALLARAERHGLWLHVENEPVCNIATVGDLVRLMQTWRHPRLRALLDIANATSFGAPPTAGELAEVMPFVDQIHCKDYSRTARRIVAMGEGDIPFASLLAPCFASARGRPLTLTVETHVPDDQPGATRRSLAEVRRLARLAGSA